MHVPPPRPAPSPAEIGRLLASLTALPLRPTSARLALAALPDSDDDFGPIPVPSAVDVDPGWRLAEAGNPGIDLLDLVADRTWWPVEPDVDADTAEALERLWRHSVAASLAARRLAREAGEPDPGRIGRAALLHPLGYWAIAAVASARLAPILAIPGGAARRDRERREFGADAASIGRALAERLGADPLVVDASWLAGDRDGDLQACAAEPGLLAIVRRAVGCAERTPWAILGLDPADAPHPSDPRIRLLTAEVQVRCAAMFVADDSGPREEHLSRRHAALSRDHARLRLRDAARGRFLAAFADSGPTEGPARWADRAALAWCDTPGVATARVDWVESGAAPADRAPVVLPLGVPDRPLAEVHLSPDDSGVGLAEADPALLGAWTAWAARVADRDRLSRRLDAAAHGLHRRVEAEAPARRRDKLEALAEFAAGAGHELNNPLAVILGRAQLLLAVCRDPDSARSLKAIVAQARRAHRILRDLMYVARPPEPRPRPCLPAEVVRSAARDIQAEADARGIRLVVEARDAGEPAWADPDPLRHLADVLLRNALEATRTGGTIRVTADRDDRGLRWSVHDDGRGLGPADAAHLLDPFYCGRQAGRGLGLGLPRAARFVARAGGDLRWQSSPGRGATFVATLPLSAPPPPPPEA